MSSEERQKLRDLIFDREKRPEMLWRIAEHLAKIHIAGHDRPSDEYLECELCGTTMESIGEPAAFCSSCIYEVADQMAEAITTLKGSNLVPSSLF